MEEACARGSEAKIGRPACGCGCGCRASVEPRCELRAWKHERGELKRDWAARSEVVREGEGLEELHRSMTDRAERFDGHDERAR